MLLDNEKTGGKVHEWITEYTKEGKFDVVTGYFTIGALEWLSRQINDKISKFRMVLGDIVNVDSNEFRPLDLLNEEIGIDAALKLSITAKEAVEFLKQDKVMAKTLEPNFCHAKLYLCNNDLPNLSQKYFITGSSNLTDAGFGLKETANVELNIANFASDPQYRELTEWFDALWEKPQAHKEKTIILENGKTVKIDFKKYLISEIEKIFIQYSPKDLYLRILFELYGNELDAEDPEFNRLIGRLENSVIYQSLYDFQKGAAKSLIRMLRNFGGAICADAVGLGKTWTALAVIKFFQLQGRETIVICPKKLEHNWNQFRRKQDSKFEKDEFDYSVRFHTDMTESLMEKYTDRADKYFTNDKPKLFVIDESHNLRNDKSQRYKFLIDNILSKNEDAKVLLLSATPINNSLLDVRNQFKMLAGGNIDGFKEKLEIGNLDYTFREAQTVFNRWAGNENPLISDFINHLPSNFFKLTDALTVARTRKNIVENQNTNFNFPKSFIKNYFITPKEIGNYDSFEDILNHLPPSLSGYQPAFYAEMTDKNILKDEKMRDRFLVKMITILMLKRLESSWAAFLSTVETIYNHHKNALESVKKYESSKNSNIALDDFSQEEINFDEDDESSNEFSELSIGTKRKITIKDIDDAGNLQKFKQDLKEDLDVMLSLIANLKTFKEKVDAEKSEKSIDSKLEKLIQIIKEKQNTKNPKVVIFTTYKDTAEYIFLQLKKRNFKNLAMVSGSYCLTDDSAEQTKNIEQILQRFAPFTKLFKEKEWAKFSTDKESEQEKYAQWLEWINQNEPKTNQKIKNPIDILITTDVLSEGQNLQDADMVINYDIHWNPVRVIQRMGRIDRLGSPNKEIFGVNFFPSSDLNEYLGLQRRVENRMVAMKLMGAEVNPDFTDSLSKKLDDQMLDRRQTERMLQQMQENIEEVQTSENNLSFNDLSLEKFRQDFLAEIKNRENIYKNIPNAIYSGFSAATQNCKENGIVALLKNRKEKNNKMPYELIYIDENGKSILKNQKEILEFLFEKKNCERFVPQEIEKGERQTIEKLSGAMKTFIKNEIAPQEQKIEEDIFKGNISLSNFGAQTETVSQKLDEKNWDLICWEYVSC